MFIQWIRASGSEIETNDDKGTVAHCESLGWKRMNGSDSVTVPEVPQVEEADVMVKKEKKK